MTHLLVEVLRRYQSTRPVACVSTIARYILAVCRNRDVNLRVRAHRAVAMERQRRHAVDVAMAAPSPGVNRRPGHAVYGRIGEQNPLVEAAVRDALGFDPVSRVVVRVPHRMRWPTVSKLTMMSCCCVTAVRLAFCSVVRTMCTTASALYFGCRCAESRGRSSPGDDHNHHQLGDGESWPRALRRPRSRVRAWAFRNGLLFL